MSFLLDMFPKESHFERFLKCLGWKPSVYGNIDHIFYGKLINQEERPELIDIWTPEKNKLIDTDRKIIDGINIPRIKGPEDYSYFVINTSVGIGVKGQNEIKRVHIRFRLISMHENILDPVVVSIYPRSMSEIVGKTDFSDLKQKEAQFESAIDKSFIYFILKLLFRGKMKISSSKSMNTQYSLPYHMITANASGTGSRAMWEFYRGNGYSAIGQYDLKIFFRIPNKDFSFSNKKVIKNLYCVDWNVEINGRRLIDHSIDFNGNWNMKVNDRKLMDIAKIIVKNIGIFLLINKLQNT